MDFVKEEANENQLEKIVNSRSDLSEKEEAIEDDSAPLIEYSQEEIRAHLDATFDCVPVENSRVINLPDFTFLPKGSDCVIPPEDAPKFHTSARLKQYLSKARRPCVDDDEREI